MSQTDKICKHWLKGNCAFVSKCKNIHVCKYGLKSPCPRGDSCPYVHMTQEELNEKLAEEEQCQDFCKDFFVSFFQGATFGLLPRTTPLVVLVLFFFIFIL